MLRSLIKSLKRYFHFGSLKNFKQIGHHGDNHSIYPCFQIIFYRLSKLFLGMSARKSRNWFIVGGICTCISNISYMAYGRYDMVYIIWTIWYGVHIMAYDQYEMFRFHSYLYKNSSWFSFQDKVSTRSLFWFWSRLIKCNKVSAPFWPWLLKWVKLDKYFEIGFESFFQKLSTRAIKPRPLFRGFYFIDKYYLLYIFSKIFSSIFEYFMTK